MRELVGANGADRFPFYTQREIAADAVIHVAGIVLGVVGCAGLVLTAPRESSGQMAALLVYAASLLTMLVCSALYNLSPATPRKRLLRRLDHAAIYLLIAGTYTPFAQRMIEHGPGQWLLLAVWAVALLGAAIKLLGLRLVEPWSSLSYLVLGWMVLLAAKPLLAAVSPDAAQWLLAGGLFYTAGVPFHLSARLRYQNAIWHGFVLAGAGCQFAAVVQALT